MGSEQGTNIKYQKGLGNAFSTEACVGAVPLSISPNIQLKTVLLNSRKASTLNSSPAQPLQSNEQKIKRYGTISWGHLQWKDSTNDPNTPSALSPATYKMRICNTIQTSCDGGQFLQWKKAR